MRRRNEPYAWHEKPRLDDSEESIWPAVNECSIEVTINEAQASLACSHSHIAGRGQCCRSGSLRGELVAEPYLQLHGDGQSL
jgi:hypothetical protein